MTRGKPHPAAMLAGATLAGLFLAAIGPFGSYLNGDLPVRALYWVAATWLGLALYGGALRIAMRATRTLSSPWPALAAAILIASVVQAIASRSVAYALWPDLARAGPTPFFWYCQVVAIGTPLTLGYAYVSGYFAPRQPWAEPRAPAPGEPALLARLPAHLGRDILCLSMEDHYVRVHTPLGSTLLLLPLSQAIAEAAPLEGLRTHRSWWVARHAVLRIEGDARAMRLHLTGGIIAPVSRPAVALLRASGWLDTQMGV